MALPKTITTTEQDAELVRLYQSGLSLAAAAGRMNYSWDICDRALKRAGVARRPKKLVSNAQEAEFIRLFRKGLNTREIGERRGFTAHPVAAALRRLGINPLTFGVNARAITDADRDQMVRLFVEDRLNVYQVADRFGVTRTVVQAELKRRGIKSRTFANGHRLRTLNESAFDDQSNPDQNYWCGLLLTDGCTSHHPVSGNIIIVLSLTAPDRGHVEKFRRFVGSNHTIGTKPPKTMMGPLGKAIRSKGTASISFSSNRIGVALARFGVVPRKTAAARLVGLENSVPAWRGCIDGDGTLGITKVGTIYLGLTGSPELTSQFAEFVSRRLGGRSPTVRKEFHSDVARRVMITGRRAFQMIELLYGHGGTSLDRKQRIADRILERPDLYCPDPPRTHEYKGCQYRIRDLAKMTGLPPSVMLKRIAIHGWPIARAVETPLCVRR